MFNNLVTLILSVFRPNAVTMPEVCLIDDEIIDEICADSDYFIQMDNEPCDVDFMSQFDEDEIEYLIKLADEKPGF